MPICSSRLQQMMKYREARTSGGRRLAGAQDQADPRLQPHRGKVGPAMPDLRSFAPADRDIKDYIASTKGKLTLHFLPGYAPDLT